MHYEVKFTGTPTEMEEQAAAATVEYLGQEGVYRLSRVRDQLQGKRCTAKCRYANLFCMMNGIRGYWPERAVRRFMLGSAT